MSIVNMFIAHITKLRFLQKRVEKPAVFQTFPLNPEASLEGIL